MHRSTRVSQPLAALTAVVICATFSGGPPPLPTSVDAIAAAFQTTPAGSRDADAAATVEQVLGSAEHPALRWSAISDVVGSLKPLYDADPDRLLWFVGAAPVPALPSTLATIAAADTYGLDAADYDAVLLAERWTAVKAGDVSGPERAHFDLGISAAIARMLKAVHQGRVDPVTMQWGYEGAARDFDLGAAVREVGRGKPLAAVLDSLEPPFPHYARARQTLVTYRRLSRAGEPESVPGLPKASPKLEPGKPWAGVPQLAARLRLLGDLPGAARLV